MTSLVVFLLLICTCGALRLPPAARHSVMGHARPPPPRAAVFAAKKAAAKKDVVVLLSEDIKGIGKKGELVNVKPAYAENFITSKGLGKVATPDVLASLEREKAEAAAAAIAAKEDAEALQAKLGEVFKEGLIIKKKVGPSGEIFGKVTKNLLAQVINERAGTKLDGRQITVPAFKVCQRGCMAVDTLRAC